MIIFDSVTKNYPGGYVALDGINLEIAPGEMVVLSGHSGAGKSTLLKLIPAFERPSSGIVQINGQNVSSLSRRAIPYVRRNIGVVLQETRLLFDRSISDNILLPLVINGHPPGEAGRRVSAALERVGLAGREKEFPAGLSGGEQQRVAIARAFVNRPSILIADEPTAHLDPAYASEIAGLFGSFNEAGVTVLVATHDISLFRYWSPRQIILDHGRILTEQ
ncbi:MAG: ATP-binding cassette domain-containing protein [Azoarcus sp.]|jgi:cell division transport system ATP-binding protein|nr:ATP-binding cassette domain-containing protein [Azoarcus sp.]